MRLSGEDGWVGEMQGAFDPNIYGMSAEQRGVSELGFGWRWYSRKT